MIIHALRNPLTAISGRIELLLTNESDLSAERREERKNCLDQCDDLNELIQDFLDIPKMEDGRLEPQERCHQIGRVDRCGMSQFLSKAEAEYISIFLSVVFKKVNSGGCQINHHL
jgi:K+-sensing histidine kinase KdpD